MRSKVLDAATTLQRAIVILFFAAALLAIGGGVGSRRVAFGRRKRRGYLAPHARRVDRVDRCSARTVGSRRRQLMDPSRDQCRTAGALVGLRWTVLTCGPIGQATALGTRPSRAASRSVRGVSPPSFKQDDPGFRPDRSAFNGPRRLIAMLLPVPIYQVIGGLVGAAGSLTVLFVLPTALFCDSGQDRATPITVEGGGRRRDPRLYAVSRCVVRRHHRQHRLEDGGYGRSRVSKHLGRSRQGGRGQVSRHCGKAANLYFSRSHGLGLVITKPPRPPHQLSLEITCVASASGSGSCPVGRGYAQ